MSNRLSLILIIILLTVISACKKKSDNNPVPPVKADLIFPTQNAVCTTGTVISATQSSINFTWNSSAGTTSYEVDIKNLLTGTVSTQTAHTNQLLVNLLRDTPYSWFVISMSDQVAATAKSDTWKFYNSGLGTVSHPPFPADALSPAFGQSVTAIAGSIKLSWTGADPDNDIISYDVYFGPATTPASFKSGITDIFVNSVPVASGTTYYWKVITKDAAGNTSDSGTFQFKVN